MDYRVISIGTLSRHELWEKPTPERSAHATTTLIRSGDKVIIVDPSLPSKILSARLQERAGLSPSDITHVFLTNFRPAHRWGLSAFEHATWWISEKERESVGRMLIEQFQNEQDQEATAVLQQEITLLQRFKSAPDHLADQVDLFPLPGFTPGTTGLLITLSAQTILIAGDAVATQEHLEQGRVLRNCYDVETALESIKEAIEIADVIILGHDNIVLNPMRQSYSSFG